MKKAKKFLRFLSIFLLFIVAVSCSSDIDKAGNEELVKKVTEATKSIKSTNAKIETKLNFTNPDQNVNAIITFHSSMTTSPSIIKISRNEERNGQKVENKFYITDDTVYIEDVETNTWKKAINEKFRQSYNRRISLTNFESVTEFLNSIKNKIKVSEQDLFYEVNYSGSELSVKEVLAKITTLIQPDIDRLIKQLLPEKIEVKYIIDKKTFLPIECKIKAKFAYFKDGKRVEAISLDEEIIIKYSEINEVEEIIIPEEAKDGKFIEDELSYN